MSFKIISIVLLAFVLKSFNGFCQQSPSASGGDINNNTGSISYSIGQSVFSNYSSSNGSVNQGVQQPLLTISTGFTALNAPQIGLVIYPNPTSDKLNLQVEANFVNITSYYRYQLIDPAGRILLNQELNSNQVVIDLHQFPVSIYYLKVLQNNQELKVFKVVKN